MIAVIPTFSPDDALLTRIVSLAGQVSSIIVVDDGSPAGTALILDRISAAGFEVIRHERNAGIAAALNAGTRHALDHGADYLLTLDQDTALPLDYVASCLHAFSIAGDETKIGVVCTDRVNGQPSIPERWTPEGLGVVRIAIQSGFLIGRECLEDCGLFDERLFIDAVDTEFCLRIAQNGYVTVVGPGTDIQHSLGEQALLRPFGIQRYVDGVPARYEYHGPVRRYYIARNNIDLYLRYLRLKPRWVLSAARQEFSPAWTTIIAGPDRGRQILATVVGTIHGLVRKRGPVPPALLRALTPRTSSGPPSQPRSP